MIPGAFFLGIYDVLTKKILKQQIPEGLLLGLTFTISGVILSLISRLAGYPLIKSAFWPAFGVTVLLNIFGQLAFYKAFKREDVSVISPLRLLIPPLVLLTGFFILRETASFWGIVGVGTTILGLWLLFNFQAGFTRRPFVKIISSPGVLWGLAGALSFSISFPFDKKAVINSSGLFFSGAAFFAIGVISLLIAIAANRKQNSVAIKILWREKKTFVLNLVCFILGGFLTIYALNFALAAYASSVKRLQSLWSVILSGRILKEGNIPRKLAATIIMLIGVLITILFG